MCARSVGISGLDQTVVSLDKLAGRPLTLKQGDALRAEVIDVLSDGSITLKINERFVTAKTEIPLPKGAEVLFKVLGGIESEGGKEIRLQFKGLASDLDPVSRNGEARLAGDKALIDLVDQYSQLLSKPDRVDRELAMLVERIFKSLGARADALPPDLRSELQAILRASLKLAPGPLHERLDLLLNQLQDTDSDVPFPVDRLVKKLMIDMGSLSAASLRDSLENSGVVLEARLKSMVGGGIERHSEQMNLEAPQGSQEGQGGALLDRDRIKQTTNQRTGDTMSDLAGASFDTKEADSILASNDLKAGLGRLKQILTEKGESEILDDVQEVGAKLASQTGDRKEELAKAALDSINGLLRDIDSLQLLSKTTESFTSFLPLVWPEMREGEIAFKRSASSDGSGRSYYCMINLELASCGSLAVMIMMQNGEFQASFKASGPQLKSALEKYAPELQIAFQELGLKLKAVHVLGHEDRSLAPFERLESLDGLLSIKI